MDVAEVVLIGALSGLYTSAWGAYKDGAWEGFERRRFPRSILFSVVIAALVAAAPGGFGEGFLELPLFLVFLLVMGIERVVTEIYKACFRNVDQDRFLIPQRLAAFGRPVKGQVTRLVLGAVGITAAIGVLRLRAPVEGPGGFVLVGLLTGLFTCAAGAHKDAPFEGFSPRKFLRSALVLVATGLLFWPFAPLPLGFVVYGLGGLERFIVEYYKSYLARSVPGKFRRDLPPVDDTWFEKRSALRRVGTALVVFVGGLYAMALVEALE